MKTLFKLLIRIRFRHSYYGDGRSKKDFVAQPDIACERLLNGYGLVLRHETDGFAVYAEVKEENSGVELVRSVGDDTLRFVFLIHSVNPYLLNISDIPRHHPGREVFYFNNLSDDQGDSRLYLGDSIASARIGTPIRFVNSPIYNYRFNSPVNAASLKLKDLLGNIIYRKSFRIPDPDQKVEEYQLDLSKIKKLVPGRYEILDNHMGAESFYYTPTPIDKSVFSIIEIFNKKIEKKIVSPPIIRDLVPTAYKFLSGDTLTGGKTYTVQFEHRKTTWRYIIKKKYKSNGVTLGGLKISGDVSFNKSLPEGKAVFESAVAVPLREKPIKITLQHSNKEIRKLPNPSPKTTLEEGPGPIPFESKMYIYV